MYTNLIVKERGGWFRDVGKICPNQADFRISTAILRLSWTAVSASPVHGKEHRPTVTPGYAWCTLLYKQYAGSQSGWHTSISIGAMV